MNVVMSCGYGRLHLVSSVKFLAKSGCPIRFICGWVPKNASGRLVGLCSRVVGRDLSSGMRKRVIDVPGVEIKSQTLLDFIDQGLRLLCRVFRISHHRIASMTWSLFGWGSRRYLKGANIFHCRSGAGRGGAIEFAKQHGIKVLVDHSALHPAKSEENLCDDYARWGQEIEIAPNLGVWKNVVRDCQDADMIMVNAEHIRDSFVERGFDPQSVRVVRLGVRADFWGIKQDYSLKGGRLKVLYTGNFSILKGAEYLLEAVRVLTKMGVEAQLDIVGECHAPDRLREQYADLPVVYHGVVPQDELKVFLSAADVYVFPSLADGCAQAGMEALAAGLPVVATYQSGLPITDGVTGCIVPMKNAAEIVKKLKFLFGNEMERRRLGTAASKLIRENYTWEKYAENVISLYDELMRE